MHSFLVGVFLNRSSLREKLFSRFQISIFIKDFLFLWSVLLRIWCWNPSFVSVWWDCFANALLVKSNFSIIVLAARSYARHQHQYQRCRSVLETVFCGFVAWDFNFGWAVNTVNTEGSALSTILLSSLTLLCNHRTISQAARRYDVVGKGRQKGTHSLTRWALYFRRKSIRNDVLQKIEGISWMEWRRQKTMTERERDRVAQRVSSIS